YELGEWVAAGWNRDLFGKSVSAGCDRKPHAGGDYADRGRVVHRGLAHASVVSATAEVLTVHRDVVEGRRAADTTLLMVRPVCEKAIVPAESRRMITRVFSRIEDRIAVAAARYDAATPRKAGEARNRARRARVADLRRRFVDGTVLSMPAGAARPATP